MSNLSQKAESLRVEAIDFLIQYDKDFRIESKHYSTTIIPVSEDNYLIHLDEGRYLIEIDIQNEILIDNEGYQYNLDILSIEDLIPIVETIKENLEKKEKFQEEQTNIFNEIQQSGYNIVTCGNCGEIILHLIQSSKDNHSISCGYCNLEMDFSDCPDLY